MPLSFFVCDSPSNEDRLSHGCNILRAHKAYEAEVADIRRAKAAKEKGTAAREQRIIAAGYQLEAGIRELIGEAVHLLNGLRSGERPPRSYLESVAGKPFSVKDALAQIAQNPELSKLLGDDVLGEIAAATPLLGTVTVTLEGDNVRVVSGMSKEPTVVRLTARPGDLPELGADSLLGGGPPPWPMAFNRATKTPVHWYTQAIANLAALRESVYAQARTTQALGLTPFAGSDGLGGAALVLFIIACILLVSGGIAYAVCTGRNSGRHNSADPACIVADVLTALGLVALGFASGFAGASADHLAFNTQIHVFPVGG